MDAEYATNEALRIRVTGETNKTVNWSGYLRTIEAGTATP